MKIEQFELTASHYKKLLYMTKKYRYKVLKTYEVLFNVA